ncbi:MAG: VanW family protein [Candidatus Borkfalkiaceae bacterium]|nr:VanW family protein [Christensenellaceae bacterium]
MKMRKSPARAKNCAGGIITTIITAAYFFAPPYFLNGKDFKCAEFKGKSGAVFGQIPIVCADELPREKNKNEFVVQTEKGVYKYFYPQIKGLLSGEKTLLGFENEVERIYADNFVAPINAQLVFNAEKSNPFEIIPEKSGKEIKKEQISAAIGYALASGKNFVKLKTESVSPEISALDLRKKCVLRSVFSTYYGNSSFERKNNVYLAASAISGTRLKSGESFSFNEVVGERSEERGYKKAKIIVSGEFVEGVGGGVCQVSTTVYNAALKAGLTVTEWHRHSLPVSYVSPSFDAMVSGTFCDLVFKNDSGSDIFIVCRADGENLTVKFYGIKSEYEYKLVPVITEVIKAETVEEYDESLAAGEYKEIVRAHDGLKSEGYMCVYKKGKLVCNRKLRTDEYAARKGLVKKGAKKVDN